MSDQTHDLKAEDLSAADRPLSIPPELPILPLRDTVLFPNSFMPLAVARESSVRLIDDAIANGKLIAVFTQRDATVEEPGQADLYAIGTATHIHKMFKLPDGSLRLIVQGLARLALDEVLETQPYIRAKVHAAAEETNDADRLEIDALARNIKANFQQVVSLSPLLSDDLQTLATNISEPGRLADFIASSLTTIGTPVKQEVLETLDIRTRMDNLNRILIKELEVLELGSKIQSQVQSEVGKNQREYFLREQMKAIQKELGEGDDQTKEIEELAEKIEAAGMPDTVKKEALRELDRLSKMPPAAAEYTVSRTYLDWLIALPWAQRTEEVIDLPKTKAVLDADHSGLEKAKDRILEYLAVRKLNPDVKGPILCFAGPPGVGKTSLARSIAESLGRKFVRVSLGGMRDEAEIRGHRRTYIGALPGQILQMMKKAGNEDLRAAFEEHLQQTEQQIERLEQVFELLEMPARGKKCLGMQNLIKEGQEMMAEAEDDDTRDALMIAAAQKVEHYEIAAYGTLRVWANLLGYSEAASIFEETLEEEKETDQRLTSIAESFVNQAAADTEDEEEEEPPMRAARGGQSRGARGGASSARQQAADRGRRKAR